MQLWAIYEDMVFNAAFRRERLFQDRQNPLEVYDDLDLIKKYRLPRTEIIKLVNMLTPGLQRPTNRNQPLTPLIQILTALRFYAKGSFQVDTGDTIRIHQSSVSRSIKAVSDLLCEKIGDFVVFPSNEEFNGIKQQLATLVGFPNVIGLIDGSHIPIKSPRGFREIAFVCRKGGHSINIQVICDGQMMFRDIVVKWPGSTHDSYIWRNCDRKHKFEDNPPDGYLLGDSGYPLEPWLMTPLTRPMLPNERKYNKKFVKTRRLVECSIGLLKSRFRCLHMSGGTLQYSPERSCKIIGACIAV